MTAQYKSYIYILQTSQEKSLLSNFFIDKGLFTIPRIVWIYSKKILK